MFIEQLYTNCLAEAAYYIESNGEAAIVDPLRETQPYIELANERGAKIKYVFETHFHADFVSGHIDLAKASGAQIIYGPTAEAAYDITVAEDNQEFQLGNIKIKVLHTPGHTLESSCFLIIDEFGKENAIFTGDTLFVGDVGRPDLAVSAELSRKDLAAKLYHSIHDKVMKLPDDVIVYPGHGAGSQCGKNLSEEKVSTIGHQRKFNYALQEESEAKFVNAVTTGLVEPPQYFPKNAKINKTGYRNIELILSEANQPLTVDDFLLKATNATLILDSRHPHEFCNDHIPGSINIGLNGFFAIWVGTLVEDLNTPILLVTERGKEEDTTLRLARVGYENVQGYLQGGFKNWKKSDQKTAKISMKCPSDFRQLDFEKIVVLDVRRPNEYGLEHWSDAINLPLVELTHRLREMDKSKNYCLYCRSGYRSVIAASIMMKAGFRNVVNVEMGYESIRDPEVKCCDVKKQHPDGGLKPLLDDNISEKQTNA